MPFKITNEEDESLLRFHTSYWGGEIVLSNNANLIKLKHIPTNTNILRSPESLNTLREQPECYGMPLLFPPGRINEGRFKLDGHDYAFPINDKENNCNLHGLILGSPWTLDNVVENGDDLLIKMSIIFDSSHVNYAGFRREFKISIIYEMTNDFVAQQTIVKNLGSDPMPCGLGYHTAFQVQENETALMATISDSHFEMLPKIRIPSGKLERLQPNERYNVNNGRTVTNDPIGMLCPVALQNGFSGAQLVFPLRKIKIIYEISDEYCFLALWNDGGGKEFCCIEPLTWLSNGPNLKVPPTQSGIFTLNPGKSFSTRCHLSVVST